MSNGLKIKQPKGGVTVFFANGNKMTAPADVWVACMLQTMDPQQREKVIRVVQATMDKMKHGIVAPYNQVGVIGPDGKPKLFQ